MIDAALLDRLALTEAAHARYQPFVRLVTPGYVEGWWARDLCRHLQRFSEDVRARRSPRMMITVPPRHGKTMHAGERLVPWHLGHAPGDEFIVTSYGADLASDISREARELVRSSVVRDVFPGLELARDTAAKVNWLTTAGGGCRAAGAGGPIVGRGADVFLCDDPIKNHKEALSAAARDHLWQWWGSTARSRISPGGGALIIQTRWHRDDLAGRLETEAAHEGWTIVRYPAIAEGDEHDSEGRLVRAAGEALHPERWSAHALEQIRRGIPPVWWRALYQGHPSDPEGAVFGRELWRHWTSGPPTPEQRALGWRQRPERFREIVLTADLTFGSQSDAASYVSIQAWGLADDAAFLLEEERGRWPYPEQRDRLRAMAHRFGASRIFVEKAAHGAAILQELGAELPGLVAVRPDGDKTSRALAAYPAIADARVLLPDPATHVWVRRLIEELCEFPDGRHDDSVDALVQMVRSTLIQKQRRPFKFGLIS